MTNQDDFEDFPTRPSKLYDICRCGHGEWDHGFNILDTTVHLFSFGLIDFRKKCEKCMCPRFKFHKKMTMPDYVLKDLPDIKELFSWNPDEFK